MKLSLALLIAFVLPAMSFAADKPLTVELHNPQGEKIGVAKLSPAKDGVSVQLSVSHLSPGKHGIHFHEKGVCTGPDFKSAGGHLNPEHKEHGLENPKGPHAGDMPNIEVGPKGALKTHFVAHGVTLGEGPNSLRGPTGSALVIHAKADDQHSNPAGDAGDRVACGVVSAPAAAAHASSGASQLRVAGRTVAGR
jgi:Cu-Zn family superoxide dismutase